MANIAMKIGKTKMSGTLYFKKPNKLRIDFQNPRDQVLVTNGIELVVYIPEYSAVMSQVFSQQEEESLFSIANSNGLALLKKNYNVAFLNTPNPVPLDSDEEIGSGGPREPVVKLRANWRNTDEGFRQLELAIGNKGLIRRVSGVTVGYQKVQIDFQNIRINQNIPDSRFEYDPPPSANAYNNFLFRPEK
jgi:outer membrane lipoprotein-sorting protein